MYQYIYSFNFIGFHWPYPVWQICHTLDPHRPIKFKRYTDTAFPWVLNKTPNRSNWTWIKVDGPLDNERTGNFGLGIPESTKPKQVKTWLESNWTVLWKIEGPTTLDSASKNRTKRNASKLGLNQIGRSSGKSTDRSLWTWLPVKFIFSFS